MPPRRITPEVEEYIRIRHREGLNAKDIRRLLAAELNFEISYNYLRVQVFQRLGLCRRGRQLSTPAEILAAYQAEVRAQDFVHMSARQLVQRLRNVHHLNLSRRHIELLNRHFEPQYVENRRRGRLDRRVYFSLGPNYIWHVDGYDKLAPFGLPIHGAVDGFSRHIMWLEACVTNHDPRQTAVFYCQAVQTYGAPFSLRTDMGTENRNLCIAQNFLWNGRERRNELPAVIQGSSNHNERIERYWGTLRLLHVERWRTYFLRLVAQGQLTCWDNNDRFLVAFCFLERLQENLAYVRKSHNASLIRKQRNGQIPTGRPIMMYRCPEMHDHVECKLEVDVAEVQALRRRLTANRHIDPVKHGLALQICRELQLNPRPPSWREAKELYRRIRPIFLQRVE